jgi:hypothetical protein
MFDTHAETPPHPWPPVGVGVEVVPLVVVVGGGLPLTGQLRLRTV